MRVNRLFWVAMAGFALASLPAFADADAATLEESATAQAAAPEGSEAAPAAESSGATAAVERLNTALYTVMKDAENLGYTGRYDALEPVVAETFDLDFMAQKSVGRHWKLATPEAQAELLDTFRRYTVANYAGRFTGWTGQEFEVKGEEDSARGTKLVRTILHDPTDEDVQLDYRLRKADDAWRIVDIYFNGTVSELALRRSEYSTLIKREGFDALIAALHERIAELDGTPADGAS